MSRRTQVNQAPLWGPKARFHAGSRAWKYSSGWKKVRPVHNAFRVRSRIKPVTTKSGGMDSPC